MVFRKLADGLSLRLSFIIFLLFPLIGVLALSGYFSLQRLEHEVEYRMQKDIELIARAIRGPLEHALEHGREGSLTQTLASAFRIGRVYGAYVYDENGNKIATSGPPEPQVRSRELAQLAVGDRTGAYQDTEGSQVYSYFVPLSDSVGRNTGLLHLTRDGSDIQEYIEKVRNRAIALLAAISLLLISTVFYGHHRILGRPLSALVRSMTKIGEGDRNHRAAVFGPREIRQLTAGMNAMLDNIALSERKIARQRLEQSRLEEELQLSQKMAAIGQLSAGVAHELGTPLSVVSGKAQRELRKQDLPTTAVAAFKEIRDAVHRMEHIVRQLLDFGRANQLRLCPTRLDDLARRALGQVQTEIQAKAIKVRLDGPQPAPALPVDSIRMEQALTNLLRNAIQAVAPGGKINLQWFCKDDRLGYTIADNGPGVPEKLRHRLFEPFFTTKAVGEGTGLGLAVAHAAVSEHGGEIKVGSSAWGGAQFTLSFPLPTEHPEQKNDD